MVEELKFQFTPAHGGRPTISKQHSRSADVSIHARARRATRCRSTLFTTNRVSIHARARRATELQEVVDQMVSVSIHARARRATVSRGGVAWSRVVSIHARARRATFKGLWDSIKKVVSIHARARRATAQEKSRSESVASEAIAADRRNSTGLVRAAVVSCQRTSGSPRACGDR